MRGFHCSQTGTTRLSVAHASEVVHTNMYKRAEGCNDQAGAVPRECVGAAVGLNLYVFKRLKMPSVISAQLWGRLGHELIKPGCSP